MYTWTNEGGEYEEKELSAVEKGSWESDADLLEKLKADAGKFLGEEARKEGVDPKVIVRNTFIVMSSLVITPCSPSFLLDPFD